MTDGTCRKQANHNPDQGCKIGEADTWLPPKVFRLNIFDLQIAGATDRHDERRESDDEVEEELPRYKNFYSKQFQGMYRRQEKLLLRF